MSKHSEETCVFCGKKEFGIETIHQIPDHICPQNFILNELLSYCNEKIKPGDFICTAHEHNIRLKYMSFKNCLPFSKKFTRKKSNFCECASCKQYCDTKYCRIIDISLLSDVFKEFILNEYTADGKKNTRTGSGIGEGDYFCSGCYQKFRKKQFSQEKGKHYSPSKKKFGRKKSIDINEEDVNQPKKCVFCNSLYDNKLGRDYESRTLTDSVLADMKLAHANGILSIDFSGCFIHDQCTKKLCNTVKKYKNCSICKKKMHKYPSRLLDEEMKNKLFSYLEKNKIAPNTLYLEKIHEKCVAIISTEDSTSLPKGDRGLPKISVTEMSEASTSMIVEDNRESSKNLLEYPDVINEANMDQDVMHKDLNISIPEEEHSTEFFSEKENMELQMVVWQEFIINLKDELKDANPMLLKSAYQLYLKSDKHFQLSEENETYIPQYDYAQFRKKIDSFIDESSDIRKHILSKKGGVMLYKTSWDYLNVIHKLLRKISNTDSNPPNDELGIIPETMQTTQTELFHASLEIRNHIKGSKDLSKIYGRYPEFLNNLSMEQLIKGKEVCVKNSGGNENIVIPGLSPLLFNFVFSIIARTNDFNDYQNNFPGFNKGYYNVVHNNEMSNTFKRTAFLVSNLLYQYDNDNCYPFPIMMSDLILNSPPSMLMDCMNKLKLCASSSAYTSFKYRLATVASTSKDEGKIPGFLEGEKGAVHMDNIEKYQKHARTPQNALAQALVIGVQQPILNKAYADQVSDIICIEPRELRPSKIFERKHKQIPEYTIKSSEHNRRQCSINDFLYESPEDEGNISNFNIKQYSHTMFRIQGSSINNQFVPSLKEVINWTNTHPTIKTNTMYLEVIPGKPDSKDTIMYALNRLEELFISKLGYKKLIVSGDAKVYDVIWKIKAEYGSSMDWVDVVLGTWHTLRDFLQHLFKKYQHAFIEKVLSTKFKSTSIESIINVNNWSRSHNAVLWILESLLRTLMEHYEQSIFCEEQNLADRKKTVEKGIECLRNCQLTSTITNNFSSSFESCCSELKEIYPKIQNFILNSCSSDEIFKFFSNALDDFSAYHFMYISIRTGSWKDRITSLKMMLERIVVSGAFTYQKLLTKHLADIGSGYSEETLQFLEKGWVSALSDGNMNSLARDEYHERTASKDIKLVLPKYFTETNLEAVAHFLPISAKLRQNFIQEILGVKDSENVLFSKGCTTNFLNLSEDYIMTFKTKFQEIKPFTNKGRKLMQPFTDIEPSEKIKNDMLNSKVIGQEVVKGYAKPRYCDTLHYIQQENLPMKNLRLSLFKKQQKKKKTNSKEKSQIEVMEALAVELMNNSDTNKESKLAGAQISKFPELYCSDKGEPYIRDNKTGVVKFMEKRYPCAFLNTNPLKGAPIIIDSLQDIVIKPSAKEVTFGNYIELFKSTKVKPYFRFSTQVIVVFDSPKEKSPKYMIRKHRYQNDISQSEPLIFEENTPIPPGLIWKDFLSNRRNKQQLVNLIVSNLRESQNMLRDKQELFIASDLCVYKVTADDCHSLRFLSNNHEEADTLMFALCFNLDLKECIIKSTDSDVLCVACISQNMFTEKGMKIVIQSNPAGLDLKYIDMNQLFNLFDDDKDFTLSILRNREIPLGVVYGIIHFLSGCDYLPHLRVFTKKVCCDALLKFGMNIFPDQGQNRDPRFWKDEYIKMVALNFHLALYYYKYGRCFSCADDMEFCKNIEHIENILNNTRKKTWHKTLTQRCNVPSSESLNLAGLRFLYVFKIMTMATDLKTSELDIYQYGWEKCPVSSQPVPIWDSIQNVKNVELLLKTTLANCGCKKSMCKTKQCSCVRRGFQKCSVLCTCTGCEIEKSVNTSIKGTNNPEINKNSLDAESVQDEEYLESDSESSDSYSSDESDEGLYNVERETYADTNDTDNDYSDQEENTLM